MCSPCSLVKFIASLRQIAVNEIAAFCLDTDGKNIVLKKNNCYYPSSVCHLKTTAATVLLGVAMGNTISIFQDLITEKNMTQLRVVLDTNTFGQRLCLSF